MDGLYLLNSHNHWVAQEPIQKNGGKFFFVQLSLQLKIENFTIALEFYCCIVCAIAFSDIWTSLIYGNVVLWGDEENIVWQTGERFFDDSQLESFSISIKLDESWTTFANNSLPFHPPQWVQLIFVEVFSRSCVFTSYF